MGSIYCLHKDTAVPTSMFAWPEISGLQPSITGGRIIMNVNVLVEPEDVCAVTCHHVALKIAGR